MIYPIYCVRDVKVGFTGINVEQNDASAIRSFAFAVNNGGIMNYSPKDFDLYYLGDFDSESGQITPALPSLITSGSSVYGAKDE